jgi:hypothetical protein
MIVLAIPIIYASCSKKDNPSIAMQQAKPVQHKPTWLHNTPLVLAENHDVIPLFRRREGGSPTWQDQEYTSEYTEAAVKKIKDLGVTLVIIPFYKGFGLQAEKGYVEDSARLASLLKKYGIRVGVYVGSTIAYETFLVEKPKAQEWFVPDYMGKPVFYGDQTFRKRVYFMHPGYREYMRHVLETAERKLHPDLIEFDNTSMQAEPPIFQHPLAVKEFREFLVQKYTSDQLMQRFGFSNMRYVLPPIDDRPMSVINDPLFQEWADFRSEQLSQYYAEMEGVLRELNPEVAIESNPHSGLSGQNTVWDQGVDYPRLVSHLDAVFTEEGDDAGVTNDGILVSRIRSFKMATTLHNTLFDMTGGEEGNTLEMAEALAFNRQCIGDLGDVLGPHGVPEDEQAYIRFFQRNFDHYRGVDNIADVAVLHSYATLAFNNDRPAVSTMLFEQVLIQSKVPFDIIFDQNLKDLSKYRVLVLPDQEALNDDKLDLVRKFVAQGGGLVATEHTSLYTEWRQRRPDFGLKDLLKVAAPPWAGPSALERLLKIAPVRNQIGQGRVVYLPEIKPTIEKPPAVAMSSQYWKLPVNWKELIDAVKWAAGGRLSLEVNAPRTVAAELTEKKSENELLVHLVNYQMARVPRIRNVLVTLQIPAARKLRQLTLVSPDESAPLSPHYTVKNQRLTFTVPQLETYTLAVIKLE